MPSRMGATLAAFLLGTAGLSNAQAEKSGAPHSNTSQPELYFFSQGYYVDQDSERALFDDDGGGFRLGFGREIRDGWYWEGNLAHNALENGIGGYTDYYQSHLGLDIAYRFRGKDQLRPFILLGIGAVHDDVYDLPGIPRDDDTSFFYNAGLGLVTPELFDIGLKFRIDARYVASEFEEDYNDAHVSLGFEIPLGHKETVRTVVQVKEVVREIPVAPTDSDFDGVVDSIDRCPNTLRSAKVDEYGCVVKAQVVRLQGITFKSGSADLTGDSVESLTDIASFLKNQPEIRLEIAGHTDSSGGARFNMDLSQKRADSVKSFLVRAGIDASRMRTRGYGETDPVATNSTASGRAMNRRVEFRIQR
ncbi:OmpA family protein [Litorivivens sp.]|uniref:OmpA family protein n=1 Tax=Litorivivens sp. TaxID=2020868 RepID=UPI00356567A5